MNKDMESLIGLRDKFRETADIIDELIELGTRADNDEPELKPQIEAKLGQFAFKMIEISNYGG